ncbi:ChbG/HpnK family deacetylase [Paenibacillus marinisediminis]
MHTRLGYSKSERLIIINADDYGINRRANEAIYDLMQSNQKISTSLIVPADEVQEATELCNKLHNPQVGIHLTLTGAHQPVSPSDQVDSLVDENGYFHSDSYEVEIKADREQVRLELQSQIEKAISLGIDPTHLDNHQGSLLGLMTGRDFIDAVFDICEMYGLPFLFPRNIVEKPFFTNEQKARFSQIIQLADDRNIPLIDDMITPPYQLQEGETYESFKVMMMKAMKDMKPGITQVVIHPETTEWNSDGSSSAAGNIKRVMEYRLFTDPELWSFIQQEGISIVTWKEIRDLYRTNKMESR